MMGQIDASPAARGLMLQSNIKQTKLTASVQQETVKQTNNEQPTKKKSLLSNQKEKEDLRRMKVEASDEKIEAHENTAEGAVEKSKVTDENNEEQRKNKAKVNCHLKLLH